MEGARPKREASSGEEASPRLETSPREEAKDRGEAMDREIGNALRIRKTRLRGNAQKRLKTWVRSKA